MSDADKDNISHAWRVWCGGDSFERRCGVRRVDFSRRHVGLKALVKRRNGIWEMKPRKAEYLD
jgi:hypothetical protein